MSEQIIDEWLFGSRTRSMMQAMFGTASLREAVEKTESIITRAERSAAPKPGATK